MDASSAELVGCHELSYENAYDVDELASVNVMSSPDECEPEDKDEFELDAEDEFEYDAEDKFKDELELDEEVGLSNS